MQDKGLSLFFFFSVSSCTMLLMSELILTKLLTSWLCKFVNWKIYINGEIDSSYPKGLYPPAMQETPVLFMGQEDSPGEGVGYPFQCSWASLVAQLVKNPPTMWET